MEAVPANLSIHILLILIMVASTVAIAVKWIKLPYSVALVLVGLFIGVFHLLPPVAMTPDLILVILLPLMLFEASWNLNLKVLRDCYVPVAVYSTLGVIVSALVTGAVLHYCAHLDFTTSFLLGSILSATDPISVLALFKRMGIDVRLTALLEGESLLNDGTAVVLFRILLGIAVAGTQISVGKIGSEFLVVTVGGTLLGIAVGIAASRLTRFFDDHLLETTLTVIVAYGSYMLAEQLHVSPVIAILVAGVVLGNYGSRTSMSPSTRLAVTSFWEYAAFLAESLVFLMIGLQIKMDLLIKYGPLIAIVITAVLIGRLCVVYGLTLFVSTKAQPIPLEWRHLLFWGGLRGSLCMAMALSLPESFPMREALVVTTFGVVLFTLLVQGLTVEPLVRFLKIPISGSLQAKYASLKADLRSYGIRIQKLKDDYDAMKLMKKDYLAKMESLEAKQQEVERHIEILKQGDEGIAIVEAEQVQKALLQAQKDCLIKLSRDKTVHHATLESFRQKIDEALDASPARVSTDSGASIELESATAEEDKLQL